MPCHHQRNRIPLIETMCLPEFDLKDTQYMSKSIAFYLDLLKLYCFY